jgi:hypothetical protein
MKSQRKQQGSINSIATGRWAAYMAAAVASTFAGAGSSEGEIHYSGNVSVKLSGDARKGLPLSNGASLLFENSYETYFVQKFHVLIKGVVSGSARGYFFSRHRAWLSNLASGENVSAGRFLPVIGHDDYGMLFTYLSNGAFKPYSRGFVGFRFNTGNGTQYGWARIETRLGNDDRAHETIKDYAWGDVGDSILTGQKQSLQPANANSVPGSLGLLAFGAQGLDAWRMQRMPKSN